MQGTSGAQQQRVAQRGELQVVHGDQRVVFGGELRDEHPQLPQRETLHVHTASF